MSNKSKDSYTELVVIEGYISSYLKMESETVQIYEPKSLNFDAYRFKNLVFKTHDQEVCIDEIVMLENLYKFIQKFSHPVKIHCVKHAKKGKADWFAYAAFSEDDSWTSNPQYMQLIEMPLMQRYKASPPEGKTGFRLVDMAVGFGVGLAKGGGVAGVLGGLFLFGVLGQIIKDEVSRDFSPATLPVIFILLVVIGFVKLYRHRNDHIPMYAEAVQKIKAEGIDNYPTVTAEALLGK